MAIIKPVFCKLKFHFSFPLITLFINRTMQLQQQRRSVSKFHHSVVHPILTISTTSMCITSILQKMEIPRIDSATPGSLTTTGGCDTDSEILSSTMGDRISRYNNWIYFFQVSLCYWLCSCTVVLQKCLHLHIFIF